MKYVLAATVALVLAVTFLISEAALIRYVVRCEVQRGFAVLFPEQCHG